LGSGGTSDTNEYNWSLTGLQNGWNQISLNISDAGITGGTPNLNAINWFRIYHSKNGSVTTRVDGIYISNGGSAPSGLLYYQAEDATISGATVGSNQAGYNGTGFVDYQNNSNDYIEWTVNVPSAGNYDLNFRYALPSGDRPLELKVNGSTQIASLGFPGTGDWTQWEMVTSNQNLNAGTNTIRLTAIGSSGGNIDELVVGSIAPQGPFYHQAEDATVSGATVESNQTGYNGTGFVDYQNNSNDYIQWTVNVPSAGNYDLSFRYALPSGDRPLELKVNGSTKIASMGFPGTGGWTQWGTVSSNQALNSGNNTVRLTAIGSSGGNIDELVVSSGGSSKSSGASKEATTLSTADISLETGESFSIKSYPNPFSTKTTLAYRLTEPSHVSIDIYNIYGQKVVSMATNEQQSVGAHTKEWNPTSMGNVSSGIYLCIIQISNANTSVVKTHKLNFMR
jgi:hypothetical protein